MGKLVPELLLPKAKKEEAGGLQGSNEHPMEHIFWDISFSTKTHHLESEANIFDYCFNFPATARLYVSYF